MWPLVKLDSIAIRGSGHTPSQRHPEYWNGGVKWVSLADSSVLDKRYIRDTAKKISVLGLRHSSAVLHPKGTVIVSRDAGVGKSAILSEEMAVSQHFIAWQCDEKRLHAEYLYQWLQSHKQEFERIAVGSTVKTIGLGYFEKMRLPLPPISAQVKTAEILATWDDAIEKTERLIAEKERQRDSVIAGLYALSDRNGKLLKFGDLLRESMTTGTSGLHAKKITVKLYGKGVLAKEEKREGSEQTQYFIRRAGQLIYSKLDFLNGAFGIIPPELDGYESTLDLPAFDISPLINPVWLLCYLTRQNYYTQQVGLARGQRKARRIHPSDLLASSLRVPPREIQDQIAEALTGSRKDIEVTTYLLGKLKTQKRGLMQKLLSGQWRVKVAETEATQS